ncbi:hypothetical protein VL20_2566 [Microcystis panniformis FACHB-1757]|uniref:Uncharacterized protein n=1 Tax=Microcystis panniformis FACHB-1757 TaxID=1638788 RepID=A0A0K1S0I7_9CHRO|nr:hypothetical protein VL20_2566 [Microcystis panniformis FACHB-1757]
MAKAISLDFSVLYRSVTIFYGFFQQQESSSRDFSSPPHQKLGLKPRPLAIAEGGFI